MRISQMLFPQRPQSDTIHARKEPFTGNSHVSGMLHRGARAWCSLALLAFLWLGIGSSVQAQGSLKAKATAHLVTLTWTPSTTKGVKYSVYRGKKIVGDTKGLTYTDTTVAAGATYSYSVVAVCVSCSGATGHSVHSNIVTVTIP